MSARVVRCEFVNNTSRPQHLVLHYMAYLNFPPVRPYSEEGYIGQVEEPCETGHNIQTQGEHDIDARHGVNSQPVGVGHHVGDEGQHEEEACTEQKRF